MSAPAAPRRTLFDIEREKRWRIWLLFALLLAVVIASVWVLCFIVSVSLYLSFPVVDTMRWLFTLRGLGYILLVSVSGSVGYWFAAQVGARGRLLHAMHCLALDPDDRYHQRLANIVEEMRLATGGPRVECFTVKTLGLNAFAFSDMHGGGVIGVTEGALARLSRQQLEGVVAHEFGHVLSGTYVTATVSCLLFGIYSELGDRLDEAALAGAATRAAPFAVVAILLRGWLWVLQLASSVTSAALSRERERQADLAAAHYTRDPLSLAEALRIISRHPGGTGYIPEGLAPLCIRDTDSGGPRLLGGWSSTHPPLEERIAALLSLANVSPDEFAREADTAAERFDEHEHWAAPPAAGGAGRRIGADTAGAVLVPAGSADVAAAPADAAPAAVAAAASAGDATIVATAPGPAVTAGLVSGSGVAGAAPAGPAPAGPVAATAGPAPAGPASRAVQAGLAPVAGALVCPSCRASLSLADYEGVRISVCFACGGRLVTTDGVAKILARREIAFTPDQQHLADVLTASGDALRRAERLQRGRPGVAFAACPKCGKAMVRRHYSYEHPVEIDYCSICDVCWFDKDELEVLQIIVERLTG